MTPETTYLWQQPDWPSLSWDSAAILASLAGVRKAQGCLLGQARQLGLAAQAEVLELDALGTSAIEGERLDPGSVRSSVAQRLGLPTGGLAVTDRRADGVVEMLLDATEGHGAPLTKERLCGWQAALFPTGYSGMQAVRVGDYRAGPMEVISGRGRSERVHFVAPPADRLDAEMRQLLSWLTTPPSGLDGVIRAGIAHVWFVTIHPFEDGNGRLARAITDMALAQDEGSPVRLYSVSAQILKERDAYYDILERQQKAATDVTEFLSWFIGCIHRAVEASGHLIDQLAVKASFWSQHEGVDLNSRQRKAMTKLLNAGPGGYEGGMTNQKYRNLTGASRESAKRDLTDLADKGLLRRQGTSGRSVRYEVAWPVV